MKSSKIKVNIDLPKYVWMISAIKEKLSALTLDENKYFRHAGQWEVDYKIVDGKIISVSSVNSVNGKELIPCSKKEWIKDNKGYV